jgi:iron complex outermembrane receptor protein
MQIQDRDRLRFGVAARRHLGGASALAIATAIGLASPAGAQTANRANETEVGEVVVTGSRAIVNGNEAPTPVTVLTGEQLSSAAPTGVADALNQLPVFRNSLKPSTAGSSGTGQNGNGGNFLNLRALLPARTLTLLNGRRAVSSNLFTGATDVNLFPQILISRVDVVTGGASAAYGSDAVAGVVNFILDTNFTGLKGEVQGGTSNRGDGDSYHGGLAYGRDYANGRGHVTASVEHNHLDGIRAGSGRGWADAGWGIIQNPNGPPSQIIVQNVRSSNSAYGGLITSGPLSGQTFNPDGTLRPFQFGTVRTATSMSGGEGTASRTNLTTDLSTTSAFVYTDFDLNEDWTAFAEGEFSEVRTKFPSAVSGISNATIFNDNAFLPAAVRAQMQQLGITSFGFNRGGRDLGFVFVDSLNDTWRGVVGLKGKLGDNWTTNLYYERSEGRVRLRTSNDPIHVNIYNAVDAVRNPATGQIVCRTTLTNPNNGCVPINLFGEGAPSAAAIDYIRDTSYARLTTTQDVLSFDVRGQLFSTWAGPISVAAGGEYRKETAQQVTDPISSSIVNGTGIRGFPASLQNNPGGFILTNPQPIKGQYDIREGFVEAVVPLLRDVALAKALDLNGAIRYADYSNAGGVTTWKVGLSYQPVEDIRLRATRSRDIRAPNISELFTAGQQTVGLTVRDPTRGGATVPVTRRATGNPNLLPEKADTTTFGVVYQPSWLPGFSGSVDAFDIQIEGAIATLGLQQIVDFCAAGDQSLCALVVRNPDSSINSIISPNLNLNSLKTSGVDIEASYRTNLADLGGRWSGNLTLRALATYVRNLKTTSSGVTIDRAGQVGLPGGVPEWTATFSATYQNGPLSLYVQDRYIDGGAYDVTLTPAILAPSQNKIRSINYVDLTARYKFERLGGAYEAFATVNNLFDQDPRISPNGATLTPRAANGQLYDFIGRYYTVGLKFRY